MSELFEPEHHHLPALRARVLRPALALPAVGTERGSAARGLGWSQGTLPRRGRRRRAASVGPNIVPSFPETTVIEITNIRANAAELGITPDTNPGTVQVTASIDISGPSTLSFTRNTANVGIPHVALRTRFDAGAVGLQCVTDSGHVTVTLEEGFASAFKTLGAPTFSRPFDQAENGYPALDGGSVTIGPPLPITVPVAGVFSSPGLNSGTGGGATQATRFMVRLLGIPGGVVTTVPKIINNDPGETGLRARPELHWVPVSPVGFRYGREWGRRVDQLGRRGGRFLHRAA